MTDWIAKLKREVARPFRRKGAVDRFPLDFSDRQKALIRKTAPFAMTTKERIAVLSSAIEYLVANERPGAFVECGVAQGGSSMVMAYTLLSLGETSREIYLFDTFEGMPEPGEHDKGRFGEPALRTWRQRGGSSWICHSLRDVRSNMAHTGYPAARVHFVKGKVEETLLSETPPGDIALLRLDTDWYASTRTEFEILYPRLTKGGIILVDDYHRWQGARKAADEYVARHRIPIFWMRIDDSAVIALKP